MFTSAAAVTRFSALASGEIEKSDIKIGREIRMRFRQRLVVSA